VQRRVEWHAGEPVAESEGVEEGVGDERVAEAAGGEFEGGGSMLHFDARPDSEAGALGAFGELPASGVLIAPAASGSTRTLCVSCSTGMAPSSLSRFALA
jgi:hypothetical protein